MEEWKALEEGPFFALSRLDCALHALSDVRVCRDGGRKLLSLPYAPQRPFPLAELFCFARIREVGGEKRVIYRLDRNNSPIF